MSQPLKKDFEVAPQYFVTLYARRYLAAKLGRVVRSIRMWEAQGVIPKPIFNVSAKSVWYTPEEIEIICMASMQSDLRRGIEHKGSEFSVKVNAEINSLRRRVRTQGGQILKQSVDEAELRRKCAFLDWRQPLKLTKKEMKRKMLE